MRTIEKKLENILRAHYAIPEDMQRRANIATLDLHFGPYTADHLEPDEVALYPSFSDAIDTLKTWLDSAIDSELWIDLDCDYVGTSEPEGYQDEETGEYIEPYTENTWHLERRDILNALFNKELVSYL